MLCRPTGFPLFTTTMLRTSGKDVALKYMKFNNLSHMCARKLNGSTDLPFHRARSVNFLMTQKSSLKSTRLIHTTLCSSTWNLQRGSSTADLCTNLSLRHAQSLNSIINRNLASEPQHKSSEKEIKGKIPFWKRGLFVAVVGGLVWYSFYSVQQQRKIDHEKVRYEEFQKAKLGGDWELTDHNGKKRSSTDFRGQWLLMYFGFTHCPDICPEELEKLIQIVKIFDSDPKLPNMLPIFITLDPERDSPTVIKDYLADLKYPRMMGFTGTEEEIGKVAKKYRAYFNKGPVDEDNDYIVDHTIIIYLINPKGEFVNFYDRSRTAERITKSVTEHINNYVQLD